MFRRPFSRLCRLLTTPKKRGIYGFGEVDRSSFARRFEAFQSCCKLGCLLITELGSLQSGSSQNFWSGETSVGLIFFVLRLYSMCDFEHKIIVSVDPSKRGGQDRIRCGCFTFRRRCLPVLAGLRAWIVLLALRIVPVTQLWSSWLDCSVIITISGLFHW